MSRLTRITRLMHTSGRQTPNPGQGGAPQIGSISPTSHSHLPPTNNPDVPLPDFPLDPHEATDMISSSPASSSGNNASLYPKRYTPKGKLIPTRPARSTVVHLPSGYPEPEKYPPPASYFVDIDTRKKDPHPLWQFFHVPEASKQKLGTEATLPSDGGSLEVPTANDENIRSGRSWSAAELRQKSFGDLHTLWYVLLKELNVLATQREERRRLGIAAREGGELITKRAFRCRKTMARIKYVLNERRLGLLAAASPLNPNIPHIPFSASPSTDPFAGTEALKGQSPIPTWITNGPIMDLSAEELEGEQGLGVVEEDLDADEVEGTVADKEVAKQEVESRDEGFGGGEEAKVFVDDVEVKDGHVQKK